jgi:hypothetical protein
MSNAHPGGAPQRADAEAARLLSEAQNRFLEEFRFNTASNVSTTGWGAIFKRYTGANAIRQLWESPPPHFQTRRARRKKKPAFRYLR